MPPCGVARNVLDGVADATVVVCVITEVTTRVAVGAHVAIVKE